jgi:hypothetical protein
VFVERRNGEMLKRMSTDYRCATQSKKLFCGAQRVSTIDRYILLLLHRTPTHLPALSPVTKMKQHPLFLLIFRVPNKNYKFCTRTHIYFLVDMDLKHLMMRSCRFCPTDADSFSFIINIDSFSPRLALSGDAFPTYNYCQWFQLGSSEQSH